MTTYFNSEKIVSITEEEMQVLKNHLFAEPGKELQLNTLYNNSQGSCRILKKGSVYEVLIVKKSEEYKIVDAISQTNEEQKQIALLKLKEAEEKLKAVAQKAQQYVSIESVKIHPKKNIYGVQKDTIGLTHEPVQLSPHVIHYPICKTHTFTFEELKDFNENKGLMLTTINKIQTLIKKDGIQKDGSGIVGTIEHLPNGDYKINYCE